MKIAIDLDGTIFSCDSFLYKVANKIDVGNSLQKLKYLEIDKTEEREQGVLSKTLKIFNHNYYKEIEDATTIIKKWNELKYDIIILSSRPSWKVLRSSVLNWLESFDVKFTMLVVACNNKAEFCKRYGVDILVDDKFSVCKEVALCGTKAIYLNRNREQKDRYNIYKATDWRDVDILVQDIETNKISKAIEELEKE
ncbi:MAG: hypothetical protein IKC11_03590 [Clostridia bacterium]|nr:hypothetical protein [Clostridia bacterium]